MVAIIYKSMPQYRRAFFELLRTRLRSSGIELLLVYGQPSDADAAKRDSVDIGWAKQIQNRRWRILGRSVIWQPAFAMVRKADLVVVEQASKLLINYVLQLAQYVGGPRLALWGHGKNFQEHEASRLGEFIKRLVSRQAWWWFAYNETSAAIVRSLGFPPHRISIVQNSIDTRELVKVRASLSMNDLQRVRDRLSLVGTNVGIFAGGMYAEKRLSFLVQAAVKIRSRIPDFELILLGSGVDAGIARAAAGEHSWIKYVGPQFESDLVPYFAMAKVALMPGLVGLGVLDSFALQVPLITTAVPYHSPEIEYLRDGVNGVIVEDTESPAAYADAVALILQDETRLNRLREGCRASRDEYGIEQMVSRFAEGVVNALRDHVA